MIVHVLVFANKTITTGEGVWQYLKKKHADKARILINQGLSKNNIVLSRVCWFKF